MWPAACQPGQRVHQHREEGHHHHHRGLAVPVEAEPHHHDRRHRHQRHGAGQRGHRQQPALQEGAAVDQPRRPTKPRPEPSARPISTACSTVCTKSRPQRGRAVAAARPRSALGAGSSTLGTSKRLRQQLPEQQHPQRRTAAAWRSAPASAFGSSAAQPTQRDHAPARPAAAARRSAPAQGLPAAPAPRQLQRGPAAGRPSSASSALHLLPPGA